MVTFYFQGNDDDIKEMSFNQILNLVGSDGRKLQFYPGIKVKMNIHHHIRNAFAQKIFVYDSKQIINNVKSVLTFIDQITDN